MDAKKNIIEATRRSTDTTAVKQQLIAGMVVGGLRLQSLVLFKQLMRYGQGLKLTDKEFFFDRVRAEFRKNASKTLASKEEVQFQLDRGQALLRRNRLM